MSYRYPVYQPSLSGREKEFVLDCLDSTWISSKGKYIAQFEREFANYVGGRHALSVSNGTVAIHVALEAIGIGPGDEVLVPTLTYVASANAVAYTGAKPVFVDSEAQYWQLDLADAEKKITPKTKAIMVVHLYGHPCNMDQVMAFARKHRLLVVEDCAEAVGTMWNGKHVGTFGAVSTFSFFGNKTITTGEGGMVTTEDDEIAARVTKLKGQGLAGNREYYHDIIGYNYRMTNICAAIGCAQMEQLPAIVKKKRELAAWYSESLSGLPLSVHKCAPQAQHSYWMVTVLLDDQADRVPLRKTLVDAGIETRPMFVPVHEMPMYSAECRSDFPVAASLSVRGINLPSYPALSRKDVGGISGVISEFFGNRRQA
jgi:perosamine synthetase